jgi:hypothetical protein
MNSLLESIIVGPGLYLRFASTRLRERLRQKPVNRGYLEGLNPAFKELKTPGS